MDSIYLYSRGDRLGSHILQYLSIIIYAFYNNLYIVYEPDKVNYNNDYEYEGTKYKPSFIVKAILNWIDNHNKKFPVKNYLEQYKNLNAMEYLLNFETNFNPNSYFYSCDLLIITTQVLYNIHTGNHNWLYSMEFYLVHHYKLNNWYLWIHNYHINMSKLHN